MANPFDDLIPKGQPKGGAFDDLIPPKSQGAPSWQRQAADLLLYGASPVQPFVQAARSGILGDEAKGFVQGDRRVERAGLQGVKDSIADAAGMPVDMGAAAIRALPQILAMPANAIAGKNVADPNTPTPGMQPTEPIGGSQFWRRMLDLNGTARTEPQDRAERLAYGFGKGAGGAATFFAPAAVMAQAAAPGSVAQGVAQTIAARPAMQAISGGVGGAVTEDTKNPWLGMAAGMAVPVVADATAGIAKRLLTPTVRLTPDEQAIAAAAQARGIELTPAQATGSRGLQVTESVLRRMPVAGNIAERGFDQQRQALNREILAQAGITADRAGPQVIDRAYQDAGQRYEALIRAQGGVRADPQFAADVARVAADYGRRLETDVAPVFRSYVEDLAPLAQAATTPGANPQVAADIYQRIRSDITTRARQTGNQTLERALLGLRDALDGAAERTRPDLAPQWQEVRQQYANLSIIDKAMRTPGADVTKGNIPLAAFRNAVRGADPEGFARGRGDMNELARIASFLQDRIPNSGTPERGLIAAALTGALPFEPSTAALAVGVPTAAQLAYGSQPVRQFLTTPPQPFMGQTAPVVESLMLQRLAEALRGGALAPR